MEIVKTKTSDGLELFGLLSEAKAKDTIIIHTHGMAGNLYLNSFYTKMHQGYPQNGISFLATQNRGSETISQFNSDKGVINIGNAYETFEECVLDIQGWVDYAFELGYKKIWLQGHSLGPSKLAYYLSTKSPVNIQGVILLSPSDMIGLVSDPEGLKDHARLLPEAEKLGSEGKDKQLLSNYLWGDYILSARTYLNFFGKEAKTAIFNYFNSDLGWEVVNSIKVPVLAITGTKDDGIKPVMDPKKAMGKLESELKNSPKIKTIVLEGAEHSFKGFESEIVDEVIKFIKE